MSLTPALPPPRKVGPATSGLRPLTGEDYVALLRRRWPLIATLVLLGPVIGYGISLALHSRYTSRSLMLIERQRVPDSYVKPLITEDLNARIAAIEERVLSRTRLQPIIERLSLFKREAPEATMEELVLRTQQAIALTPLKPIVRSHEEEVPGFYIDVTLDDAQKAQQVCAEIASMFVEENIRQREGSAQGTATFLQSQLEDAKRKLDEQDAKLAAFKREHLGMLPDEMQTNLQVLGALTTQLEGVIVALNRAQQDKAYTQSVLDQQLQTWEMMKVTKSGTVVGQDFDSPEKRLETLQNQLADLESRYKKDHPDVVAAKAKIEDLKKKIHDAKAEPGPKASGNVETAARPEPEPPQIQQQRAQIHALEQAVETNAREEQRLRSQIKEYQSRLQLSPVVEEQYKGVTRDHETALLFYKELLAKRDQSAMATDMEHRQEGEQFHVLDPANLPQKPTFPNRPLFALAGLGIGLGLGLALAFVIERGRQCVRTERDVEYYLGADPFAVIPEIRGSQNGRRNGTRRRMEERAGLRLTQGSSAASAWKSLSEEPIP